MQSDIITLINRLTPAKPATDSLAPDILLAFKTELKNNPELNNSVFSYLQQRARANSSQVRFLVFQLVNYIFCRSAHFRRIFCQTYVLPFINLFIHDLPPPESMASRLKNIVTIVLAQWETQFGKIYPQLKILLKEVVPKMTKDEKVKISQSTHLTQLVDVFNNRYLVFFKEIQNILDLMDSEKCHFTMPSDEYEKIVIELLREKRNQLNNCARDLDVLKTIMNQYRIGPELKTQINSIIENFTAIEQKANQIGMNDDEFDDASDEDEDEDEENDEETGSNSEKSEES